MAFLKRITPYAIVVLLLAAFYVPPPLGKTPYEYLRSFSLYRADLPPVQATPYDYLMFVVQWPFAFCADQKCTYKPLPDVFTIHGIWPAKYNGDRLTCTGTPFSESEMEKQPQLENNLQVSWPDLVSKANMRFWKYEYDKHGKCCDNIFAQTAYFQRAHDMWSVYHVEVMFKDAGYRPGNSYKPTDLQAAVKTKTTKDPALRCKNLPNLGGYLLVEVVICYDRNGKNVIDCNSKLSGTCSQARTILYKDR